MSSFILSPFKCTAEKYDTACAFRTSTWSAITASAMGWFQTGVQWKDCTNMPKWMDTNVHWWLLLFINFSVMGFLDVMLLLSPSISHLSSENQEHYTHLQIILQLSFKKNISHKLNWTAQPLKRHCNCKVIWAKSEHAEKLP